MALKDNLKKRRKDLNLTLEDVAKIVGVTRQTIQKYESGIVTNIPSDKIELLAFALKTSPAYIMGWESNPQIDVSDDEYEVILSYRSASDEIKNAVKRIVKE